MRYEFNLSEESSKNFFDALTKLDVEAQMKKDKFLEDVNNIEYQVTKEGTWRFDVTSLNLNVDILNNEVFENSLIVDGSEYLKYTNHRETYYNNNRAIVQWQTSSEYLDNTISSKDEFCKDEFNISSEAA